MWQYTSRGTVDGIAKSVDMNVAYFRLDQENQAKDSEAPEQIAGGPELGITFQEVQETVTAKIATNLRTEPGVKDDSTIVAQLKHGDTATRTGIGDNGWSRVIYQGQTLYALTSYLTTRQYYCDTEKAYVSVYNRHTAAQTGTCNIRILYKPS